VIDDLFEQTKNDYAEDWVENWNWDEEKSLISSEHITKERLSLAERYNILYEKEILHLAGK
jgi:hypothetical protein